MKLITIHYLPHTRLNYSNLFFYYLNKLKIENKDKLILNIYTNNYHFFEINCGNLVNIEYHIISTPSFYPNKIGYIKNNLNVTKYSMKLDEDVFITNQLFDYMIENLSLLDNNENLIFAPLLSCGIPTGDIFIKDFFNEEDKNQIYNEFLKFGFGVNNVPENPWGYNVKFLNKLTLETNVWNSEKWVEETNNIPHHFKGYHPLRNGYYTHEKLNELLLKNIDKFKNQTEFDLIYLKNRYYTNSAFFIKSDTWLNILNDKSLFKDDFDEVPLNAYMKLHNLNYVFVKYGYSIHTTYNTNYIPTDEYNFYCKLEKLIIN